MKTTHLFVMFALASVVLTASQAMSQTTSTSSSSSYSSSSSTGPDGTTYSSSSNAVTLKDTPIMEALATVSRTTRTAIFVSEHAEKVLSTAGNKVTVSEQNLSPEMLFAKVLSGTDLVAVPMGSNICILSKTDSIEELKSNVQAAIEAKTAVVKGLIPLSVIHMNHALRKPITLTMVQTPVPFVIQMLEGMSQVKITLPPENQGQFFGQQPLVSVNARGEPLQTVLESVAKQMQCELRLVDGAIAIQKPTAKAPR